MMLTCITQHLSNIWSSIHEQKLISTKAKLKKRVAYKNVCTVQASNCASLCHRRLNRHEKARSYKKKKKKIKNMRKLLSKKPKIKENDT